MKVPLVFKCHECQQTQNVFIDLSDSTFQETCTCGADLSGSFANDVTTGFRLLWRSKYELKERKDYSLSIVFSATAFECEISRLYFKWKFIESDAELTDLELEEQLRNFGTVKDKIKKVSKLMDARGLTEFVKSTDILKNTIIKEFPSINIESLEASFQEKLFWPRNRVLHLGYTNYKEEDALRCLNISVLGMRTLELLDRNKQKNI